MAWPLFADAQLSSDHKDFYWRLREQHDVYFAESALLPHELNLARARQHNWIGSVATVTFLPAIDFGAGDCAGAYVMSKEFGLNDVLVVDSSSQTKTIANAMGFSHSLSLDAVKPVEFISASSAHY